MTENLPIGPFFISAKDMKTTVLDRLDALEKRMQDLELIIKYPMYQMDKDGNISILWTKEDYEAHLRIILDQQKLRHGE